MTHEETANIILKQMGGYNRLYAMIGIDGMYYGEDSDRPYLQFSFKGSREHNKCRVILDHSDTYIFQLYKIGRGKCEKTFEQADTYCDMLIETFEQVTGLDLSL